MKTFIINHTAELLAFSSLILMAVVFLLIKEFRGFLALWKSKKILLRTLEEKQHEDLS